MLVGRSAAKGEHRARTSSSGRDEARLIEQVAARDARAFEELYRIYHPRLTRFLGAMLRRRPMVEEVLNDSMLVVWNRPDSFNGTSKVSTWIFAIAYRKALKALRRHDDPMEDKDSDMRESAEAGPERQLERRQLQAVLMNAVSGLSADHRAVVDLTYFHEMEYREIAEIMACPVDTVKTRMFYARRHLKSKLPGRLADWL